MEFPAAAVVGGRPKLYLKNAILSIVKIHKKNEPKFGSFQNLKFNQFAIHHLVPVQFAVVADSA